MQKRVGTTVWLCLASAGCRNRCTVKVFAGTARRPGLASALRDAGCTIEVLSLVAHGLCDTHARQDGRFSAEVFVALACAMRRANSHIQLEPAEVAAAEVVPNGALRVPGTCIRAGVVAASMFSRRVAVVESTSAARARIGCGGTL